MILLIGPSASGKTQIAYALTRLHGIKKAITHTTRAPREGEKDGVDYHFVDVETFLKLKEQNAFVETTLYNGNYYGCSKAECGRDRCIVVDPKGLLSFLALGDPTLVTFYLECSEEVRRKRMEGRLDPEESIRKRIENDRLSFTKETSDRVDFVLSSDEKSVDELTEEVYRLYQSKLNP